MARHCEFKRAYKLLPWIIMKEKETELSVVALKLLEKSDAGIFSVVLSIV